MVRKILFSIILIFTGSESALAQSGLPLSYQEKKEIARFCRREIQLFCKSEKNRSRQMKCLTKNKQKAVPTCGEKLSSWQNFHQKEQSKRKKR